MKRKAWLVMLMLVFTGGASAQEICPALVRAAFETAAESCVALARNQACYGNVLLEVEAQPDAPPITFEQAGDIADLGNIASLRLSPMNTAAETWGMALLRTQANLPDTLPGQNVTMILFGEVEMTDAAPEPSDDDTEAPTYTPMQAFYFTSAIGDSPCAEAPDSGILIQTPQGAGTINLLVNGVEIELGSTGYLQAQPDGEMVVNILEGQGIITSEGASVTIPAGGRARVPLDEDGQASGEPVGPEPYDEAAFSALPLVLLPEEITVAPALDPGAGLQEDGDFSSFTGQRKSAFCHYLPVAFTTSVFAPVPSASEYLAEYHPELVDDEQLLSALSQSEQIVREAVAARGNIESPYLDAVNQFCD